MTTPCSHGGLVSVCQWLFVLVGIEKTVRLCGNEILGAFYALLHCDGERMQAAGAAAVSLYFSAYGNINVIIRWHLSSGTCVV